VVPPRTGVESMRPRGRAQLPMITADRSAR